MVHRLLVDRGSSPLLNLRKKLCTTLCQNQYFLDASAVFIDSTHIKASANKHKTKEVKITKPIKAYQQELEAEINELRLADGKKKLTLPSQKKS